MHAHHWNRAHHSGPARSSLKLVSVSPRIVLCGVHDGHARIALQLTCAVDVLHMLVLHDYQTGGADEEQGHMIGS